MPFDSAPSPRVTPLTVLKGARVLINDKERWIKGAGMKIGADGRHSYCAIGAVRYAAETLFTDSTGHQTSPRSAIEYTKHRAIRALAKALDLRVGVEVVGFNDAPLTQHKDVLAAFDKAITTLAAKELTDAV